MLLNDLRKNITDTIIQSNLSIDCIYFVLKDIMNEVVDIYNKQLQNEEANTETTAQESEQLSEAIQEAEEINKTEEE